MAPPSRSVPSPGGAPANAGAPAGAAALNSAQGISAEAIQELVDQAAGFNLFAVPDANSRGGESGYGVSGSLLKERLYRFDVELVPPSGTGVQAMNTLGEEVGTLELQWFIVPDDFLARPDRQPPAIRLYPGISQRFVMQQMTFRFADGRDGFQSFGTGRTFPMMTGDQPRIMVSAVGNVTEGHGRFRNLDGNFTICGDLTPAGFKGNILVRFQDPEHTLRVRDELPTIQPQRDPDPQITYLLWSGKKGAEQAGVENHFSFGPDGQVRGLDITTQLRILQMGFAVSGSFLGKSFTVSKKIIGTEIGFGRGSIPTAPPTGTPVSPYLFEGVAKYSFFDSAGRIAGTILTNVTEGRRFDMNLRGVPGDQAWRFGFFGPIIYGTGCFRGVQGIFYGSSGSVFYSPPEGHVVTHFYMARISDPEGKFRAPESSGGWF